MSFGRVVEHLKARWEMEQGTKQLKQAIFWAPVFILLLAALVGGMFAYRWISPSNLVFYNAFVKRAGEIADLSNDRFGPNHTLVPIVDPSNPNFMGSRVEEKPRYASYSLEDNLLRLSEIRTKLDGLDAFIEANNRIDARLHGQAKSYVNSFRVQVHEIENYIRQKSPNFDIANNLIQSTNLILDSMASRIREIEPEVEFSK